jgi:hypothetical protein
LAQAFSHRLSPLFITETIRDKERHVEHHQPEEPLQKSYSYPVVL